MKKLLPISLLSLLLGTFLGYGLSVYQSSIGKVEDDPINDSLESVETDVTKDTLDELQRIRAKNEALEAGLSQKQAQLDTMMAAVAETAEVTEQQKLQLKKQWILQAINRENTGIGNSGRFNIHEMSERLGLTLEQATLSEDLIAKRNQQREMRRLIAMGILTQQEYESMFPEISSFDYGVAFNSILSPEQQQEYKTYRSEARERSTERITTMMGQRLNLNDAARFSDAERESVNGAIKAAMSRRGDIEIPAAIQELSINDIDKRILTTAYEQLDSETFQKLYTSVVEENKEGGSRIRMVPDSRRNRSSSRSGSNAGSSSKPGG